MKDIIVVQDILPLDSPKRVGKMVKPSYITIHETETGLEITDEKFNYKWYRTILDDYSSTIGYHFLVEANNNEPSRIYQFLETNVYTHHTGNAIGNQQSIGIERIVNKNTDMIRAIDTQAFLTAILMKKFDIPIENVLPHKYWNNKDCPSRLLAGLYCDWDSFINKVKEFYSKDIELDGIKYK